MKGNVVLRLLFAATLTAVLWCDASAAPPSESRTTSSNAKGAKGGKGVDVEPVTLPKGSRRWAFLVGVDQYENPRNNLKYCSTDVTALRDRLAEIGFDAAHTVCLTSKGGFHNRPVKNKIDSRFAAMLNDVKRDDIIFVAFSGHGANVDGVNYFCPADVNPSSKKTLVASTVSLDAIYSELADCRAQFKLLLVDACRNNPLDGGGKSLSGAKALGAFAKSLTDAPAGLIAMRSCLPEQQSYEHPKLGHGVFMYHVLQGLRGRADREHGNRNGRISLLELCGYTSEATSNFVRVEWPGKRQTPTIEMCKEFHDFDLVDSKMLDLAIKFTVRLQKSNGPTLNGTSIALARYDRWNDKTTVLAESKTDNRGRVELNIPYEKLESNGSDKFLAMVSCLGKVRRIALPGFPDTHLADLLVDLPKDFTNSIGMKFKLIPVGKFMMGSPEDDKDRSSNEGPVHRVRITNPYYLGAHEVTLGEFRAFVEATGYKTDAEKYGGGFGFYGTSVWASTEYTWRNPRFSQEDDHPVVEVSWNDTVAFCKWLSRKEGQTYRLPYEAEWEYACRAGTKTRYYHGDNEEGLAQVGNVADATAKEKFPKWAPAISARDGFVFTAPIGRFRPNAWGLYDMHGNVSEWCSDWFNEDYYAKSPTDDPIGPIFGSERVVRGGEWCFSPKTSRSADRHGEEPAYRSNVLGFRVALVPLKVDPFTFSSGTHNEFYIHLLRAITNNNLKQLHKAIEDCNTAIALAPKNADLYRVRAYAYNNLKQFDNAIKDCITAITLTPKDDDLYCVRAYAYSGKGEWGRGDIQYTRKAVEDASKAIELNRKNTEAYRMRAIAYNNLKQFDKAIEDCNTAIALTPKNADLYRVRAYAYNEKSEYDMGIQDASKAIELNPKNALAYIIQARAYERKDEYDRAIKDCDRAIELSPKLGDAYCVRVLAYCVRGLAYNGKGEYDRAIKDCDRAIELNPKLSDAYRGRGLAYNGKGEYDRAIKDYSRAIELDPKNVEAYINRADAYKKLGNEELAEKDRKKAQEYR